MALDSNKSPENPIQQGDWLALGGAYLVEVNFDKNEIVKNDSLKTTKEALFREFSKKYVQITREILIQLNRTLFKDGDEKEGKILTQLENIPSNSNSRFFIRKEFVQQFNLVRKEIKEIQESMSNIIPFNSFKK